MRFDYFTIWKLKLGFDFTNFNELTLIRKNKHLCQQSQCQSRMNREMSH